MVQLSYSYMTPRKTIALNIQTFDGKVMFLLQITVDSDCSHEIKRQRCCFADKGPCSQSYGFFSSLVPMWELDHEDEHQRTDALNYGTGGHSWESLGQQGEQTSLVLKEINPEYLLEGLMLKVKLHQYFGHLMWRAGSLEKTLMLGKIEGRRRRGQQRDEMVGWHHRLGGHEFEQAPGLGDGQGSLLCCSPWSCKESDTSEWLNNKRIYRGHQ